MFASIFSYCVSLLRRSLVQAVTCNCLTTRESTLVCIHARNMTVYRRALCRCHTIFSSRLSYIFTLFVSIGPQGIQTSGDSFPLPVAEINGFVFKMEICSIWYSEEHHLGCSFPSMDSVIWLFNSAFLCQSFAIFLL